MKKALSSLWLSAMVMASSVMPVLATQESGVNEGEDVIELKAGGDWATIEDLTIPTLVSAVIQLILIIAALVFFFLLIVGGIQWMTSGGDKAAAESARGRITAALIGLVIVFSAWAIAALIGYFFQINIFELNIPKITS
jgi:hypothetical protein